MNPETQKAEVAVDNRSEGAKLLTSALVQIEMTLNKADEALTAMNTQLRQIQDQKIGLTAQKTMVMELKRILEERENATQTQVNPWTRPKKIQ